MIFGLTNEERKARNAQRSVEREARLEARARRDAWKHKWHAVFVWFPVELLDGRGAWLRTVERKRNEWDEWTYRLPARPVSRSGGE